MLGGSSLFIRKLCLEVNNDDIPTEKNILDDLFNSQAIPMKEEAEKEINPKVLPKPVKKETKIIPKEFVYVKSVLVYYD